MSTILSHEELKQEYDKLELQLANYREKQKLEFEKLTPSWYIYTGSDEINRTAIFHGCATDKFFYEVSRMIAYDDINLVTVQKIYYRGKEVKYAGWQPGMKFEYKDLDGNTVWVGNFPEWDH